MLNLSEAARESKQSKSAIWRAVNSGRLSATRTYSGDYQIDPAELHHVFSSETADERATTVSMRRGATELERAEAALMQEQIERLFQVGKLIRNELDNDRDAWRSQADRLRQLVG
jgi:hypothetical protein